MNSYQPTSGVTTLLSLDLGRDQSLRNKPVASVEPSNNFQRALADQSERSESQLKTRHDERVREPAKDTSDASRPLESKANTSDGAQAATNDDVSKAEDSVKSESNLSQSEQSENTQESTGSEEYATQETLVLEASDGAEGELLDVVDESLAADAENSSIEEIESNLEGYSTESGVQRVDAEESIISEELVEDVSAAAPLIQSASVKADDAPQVLKEALPFQSRKQEGNGVAGLNPNALKEESSSKINELSLDSTTHKKTVAEAAVVEVKPGAAKQMNNLLASLNIGQSASRSDQAFKELMGQRDSGPARAGSTSAATGLVSLTNNSRIAIATPLAQVQAQVPAGVGQPKWQAAIAERIAFMSSQKITSAEIRLDPPELGPLQVKVHITQDQASVSFTSQNAVVREALDQTAFRLRDMFNSEGINLVDVDVSDQSFANQPDSEQGSSAHGHAEDEVEEEVVAQVMIDSSASLIDHFV